MVAGGSRRLKGVKRAKTTDRYLVAPASDMYELTTVPSHFE